MSNCVQYEFCDYDEGFSTEFIDGAIYGSWEVLPGTKRVDQYRDGVRTTVECECWCGKSMRVHVPSLCGLSKCCYHPIRPKKIAPGMMFGFWEVLGPYPVNGVYGKWVCECLPCGKQGTVSAQMLKSGQSRMCSRCQLQAVMI